MFMHRAAQRAPCGSLQELTNALKDDINAGMLSSVPECTTSELILGPSALVPLHRPNIGPYAEGGDHDLPPQFKESWTEEEDSNGKKSQPQATVASLVSLDDLEKRAIVQRAASRGIIAAIEAVDGFRYSFNNVWSAKDEDGKRFSYVCQDSMQNKDRHANGFTKTQKYITGEGAPSARKPTYDCKGNVSVKCSLANNRLYVYYRHYAIHPTISDRKSVSWQRPAGVKLDVVGRIMHQPPLAPREVDTGGLFGKLQNEESAFETPPPPTQPRPAVPQTEPSNIGRPLKRKRETDAPQKAAAAAPSKPFSLVELLRQSQSADSSSTPAPTTPKTTVNGHPPPVSYDLPSWQQPPPPVPVARPVSKPKHISKSHQRDSQFPAPYPPPYQPAFPPAPNYGAIASRGQPLKSGPAPPPPQKNFGPPKPHPQSQGLFSTLKPVSKDPAIEGYIPFYSARARSSCTTCRNGKKKCDEQRPICGACQKAGRHECVYEGVYNENHASLQTRSMPMQPPAPQMTYQGQMAAPPMQAYVPSRTDSPDPWFPKR